MDIILNGYFDSNFGDDYMQKIMVSFFPEYNFLIPEGAPCSDFILREKNVFPFKNQDKNIPVLLVTGSGFMINSSVALREEIKMFLKNQFIADFCMGCNIEPLDSALKEYLIKKKLRKFSFIVCRDKKSFDWLKRNMKKTDVYYLPDILFSMPESWIPERNNDKNLGISLFHRKGDGSRSDYYVKMAETADFFVEHTGRKVILMAFDTGLEDDVFSCRCVKELMTHKSHAEIVCHGSENEILKAYASCFKIIGARYHSGVLAMKMGIDFFPVICRSKMKNLIEDLSYPYKGCGIDHPDTEKMKEFILSSEKEYTIKDEIVNNSEKYIEILNDYLL